MLSCDKIDTQLVSRY